MSIENTQHLFGVAGGIVILIALVVYLVAIVRGKVQSNRVTWGVWTVLTGLMCASYYGSAGWVDTLWVSVAYFMGHVLIFTALLVYAKNGAWTWVEKMCIPAIVSILLLWLLLQSPLITLLLLLCVDLIGSIPLLRSIYSSPQSDYGPAWALGFVGNALNLFAVERWDFANAAYPTYFVLLTLTVSVLLYRHQLGSVLRNVR